MPAPTAICPICARPISPSAPKGLCPVCLAASLAELFVEAAGENAEPKPALAAPNERLGDYELLDELGRGGMGVVFRARDWRLNRVVALKLILTGELASQAEVKRFHNEAEAAAQLEHPNIVPIYEIGESEGRHFFAMKLVEGGSLAGKLISGQYLASSNQSRPADGGALNTDSLNSDFSPQTSTALVAKVARAVHHAHRRGILHRDLKPGNILLDAVGEPMVADFGLARRVDNASGMTLSGAVVGSPSYMAPEQAAGGSRDVTVAADIYSLGAIFYELLAGRPPFDGATPMEVMRKVIEDEPQPPSRSGKRVINHQFSVTGEQWDARHPKTDDWLLDTEHSYRVDGDLQTICLKCLRKDPRQRYVSAEALAEDLERWQRHEPILARPSSLWEQTAKWVRRRPALAGLLGVSAAALLGFIAMQFANEAKLTHERDRATTNEVYALAEARLAASNALNARLNLYAADMFLVGRALDEGNLALARRTLARHMPRAGEVDLRGFEWRYFREQARGAQFQTFTNFTDAIFSVAFSPDGRGLAAAGANLVQWFNATNLQLLATLTHDSTVHSVCFSADGATLWTGDSRGQGRAWSESGGALTSLIHRARATSMSPHLRAR